MSPIITDKTVMSPAEHKLRFLLAMHVSGGKLYGDDGELSDSSEHPFVDYLRDDPDTIEAKLIVRSQKRLQEQYEGREIVIDYTNWEGKRSLRRVQPKNVVWGSTQWHPEPQWLLVAVDLEKNAERQFAMTDIHMMSGRIGWILEFLWRPKT